jgi:heme-degrading monooxygenase HmoA
MIARIWHGMVPAAKAEEYRKLMCEIALPEYSSTPGNLGAWCLHRVEGAVTHFLMLTHWEDVDAIKRFAGDDIEIAKYYDFDRDFLIELEPGVQHYTVDNSSSAPAT